MIVDFPRFDTRKPFQDGDDYSPLMTAMWSGEGWGFGSLAPIPAMVDFLYGENTLFATGLFLRSQILRYHVTKEPEALTSARKCFRDLNRYFRMSGTFEPGLLGKPHGGRPGPTWSYDQAAIPVIYYAQYAKELATPEERTIAETNLVAHGEMYLRRNWVINAHGHNVSIVESGYPSAMKLLAAVYPAYEITGDVRFRDEILKYLRVMFEKGAFPWPWESFIVNHNMYYWSLLCEYWSQSDLRDEFDWIGCISGYWQAVKSSIGEDDLALFGNYNRASGVFTPHPRGYFPLEDARRLGVEPAPGFEQWWMSPTCYYGRPATSAFAASLALMACAHGLDDDAHLIVGRILRRMDEDTLRWWWDDGTMPAELKEQTNFFATEVVGAWLSAYWTGRLQGVL